METAQRYDAAAQSNKQEPAVNLKHTLAAVAFGTLLAVGAQAECLSDVK
jgi:hypothetical protein